MEGGLALALVVIVAFGAFILWAKTAAGRRALKNAFGDPRGLPRRQKLVKKSPARHSKTSRKR
jgi:hypothetical protein